MKDLRNIQQFLSCDWGTTSFRLRLIDAKYKTVLSEIKTGDGIADTFQKWKKRGENDGKRKEFYMDYVFKQVEKLKASYLFPDDLPIILSGMASSSIGMMELPYQQVPFRCDGSGLVLYEENYHKHPIIIISGVQSKNDVMRGEETMLAGCAISNDTKNELLIFPGTHSKHILVTNGLAENFATYMTGEVFDLLSNKSVLSASIQKGLFNQNDNQFFIKGVVEGAATNLLNSIFHVRTNQLFKKTTAAENYFYLSGLLIGYELKTIIEKKPSAITLVCNNDLKEAYLKALNALEPRQHVNYKNADEVLINGQWKILNGRNHSSS